MNRLFINLYLDEDVSVLIGELLRRRGFVALTARDAGQLGTTDAEQLAFATARRMALLTHNHRDYEQLARQYVSTSRPHSGIFVAVRRQPYEVARRILVLLDRIAADEMDNQVVYL